MKEFTDEQKKQYGEKKKQKLTDAFSLVDDTALKVFSYGGETAGIKKVLEIAARFPQYSMNNALMIFAQRPDASELGNFEYWQDRGGHIRSGERGITLIERKGEYEDAKGKTHPRYQTVILFDVLQTSCTSNTAAVPQKRSAYMLDALKSAVPSNVKLEKVENNDNIPNRAASMYYPQTQKIVVANGMQYDQFFVALVNQIAMSLLDRGGVFIPDEHNFEAACIAYMVCSKWNVATNNFTLPRYPEEYNQSDDPKFFKSKLYEFKKLADIINTKIFKYLDAINKVNNKEGRSTAQPSKDVPEK